MKTQIAAAIALAFASSLALAQAKPNAGWYLGGSVGQSSTRFTAVDFNSGGAMSDSADKNKTAGRLMLGYNFNSYWALEGAYTYLGRPKYRYSSPAGSAEAKLDQDAWSLALKGAVPLNDKFDLFGRVGLTYNRARLDFSDPSNLMMGNFSSTHNNSTTLVGLGFEYKVDKKIGLRAEYENYGRFGNTWQTTDDTGRTDIDLWSVGLVIRF